VQVIDEDLGKSGTGSVERHGFQKLIAEIGLGNAGLVVSLDASRLARNNRDWQRLRPKRRSKSIRRRRSHSPSLAHAVAVACSSSRPSMPAANRATSRPQ